MSSDKNTDEEFEPPKTVLASLDNCSPIIFSSIYNILLIFGTLPVSVDTAERRFSTLR
ncbi:Uncharacterized protein FWK35_00032768, partial [Aphis craccivora]